MGTSRNFIPACRFAVFSALALALCSTGCKNNPANTPAPIIDANNGTDPAAVNNAPVSGAATQSYQPATAAQRQPARVLGQQAYPPQQPPTAEQYPEQQPSPAYQQNQTPAYNPGYDEQAADAGEQALYADQAPPPLPEYQQPELTDVNDQWTPGYWNYGPGGYYWVPGAWVAPPYVGALWTPGYWGAVGGRYRFHLGFWGRHIGFYGGVPYGFGYTGRGYEGGYWNGDRFFYNNAVNRVNLNVVRNVYVRNVTVINNNRVSYNGPGGWQARPSPSELAVLHEQRTPPMQVQFHQAQAAAANRQQFYAENHGRPAVAVVAEHVAADRVAPQPIHPTQTGANTDRSSSVGGRQIQPERLPGQQSQQQQNALRQQPAQERQQPGQERQQPGLEQQQVREQQQNVQRQQQVQQQQNTQREQQQNALRQQQVQQRTVQDQQQVRAQQQNQPRQQQQVQQRPQQVQQTPAQPAQRQPPPTREQPAPRAAPRTQETPRVQPAPRPEPQQARPQPARPAEPPHAPEEHPKR